MYFKPLKIFIPLSGILLLAGIGSGLFSAVHGQSLSGVTILWLVAGLQVAALGLLADLLVKRGR